MSGIRLIRRSSIELGGIAPPALATLSGKSRSKLYNHDYGLRHPFGIYTVSLDKLLESFEDLLSELEQSATHDLVSESLDVGWDEALLSGLEKLLYSIMEHFDDCESVLKCFLPPRSKHGQVAQVSGYTTAIDSYRTHIGKAANHLKHKQGRLRSIALYDGSVPHLGYFIEGPAQDGSLGPAPLIHTDGNSAFSYARDLRLHFHGLYFISEELSKAASSLGDIDVKVPEFDLPDDERSRSVASKIADLPMVVFPDEFNKNFPAITLERGDVGELTLLASLKRNPKGLRTVSSPFQIVTFYRTDGVTRAFRMPYSR